LESLKALMSRIGNKGRRNGDQSLHFDGLYFSFKGDVEHLRVEDIRAQSIPCSYFLKFYQDGLVIFAVISCKNISKDVPKVVKWFTRDWKEASSTRFQQAGNKLQFCFDDRLTFNGQILTDGTIRFKIHNQSNDKKWKERFAFWSE
jgi:hypothetical protein